jgi:hypothetical protein
MKMTHRNGLPYVVVFDKASKETIIGDRLFRPLVRVPGRYPHCGFAAAVECEPDAPRLYGAVNTSFLYHDDNAPVADPIVRRRLADLLADCPALKALIYRKREEEEAAHPERLNHAQLMSRVFSEAAA